MTPRDFKVTYMGHHFLCVDPFWGCIHASLRGLGLHRVSRSFERIHLNTTGVPYSQENARP